MIAKTMLGSLVVLYLLASVLTTAVADEPPDYDATGTWDYEINNLWSSCSGGEPAGATGTVQIVQTADTFSIQADGGAPDYGSPHCVSCQQPFIRPGSGQPMTASGTDPAKIRPAGFLRRFVALFIDFIIFILIGDVILFFYQLGLGKGMGVVNLDFIVIVMTLTEEMIDSS